MDSIKKLVENTGVSKGKKTEKISNADSIKKLVENTGVTKGKKFLFLIRHPLCYS